MDRQRLINRRQQGDLGEISATEWFARAGALVFTPVGHSPDVDLIVVVGTRPIRVQVKTSTVRQPTPNGHERWQVAIRTNGGNRSWTGTTKFFDPAHVDCLFVLVGDGRHWLLPATAVESIGTLNLGGEKYSEFEIDPTGEIMSAVFGEDESTSRIGDSLPGERRSWRAGRVCKIRASLLSEFESHLPHEASTVGLLAEHHLGRPGQSVLRHKRQVTMPAKPMDEADLHPGDRLRWRAAGPGRLMIERIDDPPSLFEVEGPETQAG